MSGWKLAWLALAVTALTAFAVIEGMALSRSDGVTLSQTVVDLLYVWPPAGWLIGIIIGILICHFTWHWVPTQKRATCPICNKTILLDH